MDFCTGLASAEGSVEGECWGEQCCLRTASVVVQWVSALVTH